MIRTVIIALPFVLVLPAFAFTFPAPISQAESGKVQCYQPNLEKKTCRSISGFSAAKDGGFSNPATILVQANPMITVHIVAPVTVKDGKTCGTIRQKDLDQALFSVDAAPASAEQGASLHDQLNAVYKDMIGHEVCVTYVPDGDGFIARGEIDGAPQPNGDQHMIWVAPTDGYHVGP
ncbi:MAG TPA: hypothetical protein VG942_00105 [Hyphomonadaceae bacterium]|nr:hypothetical protein [Hyphomonadaceae bacterium]